MTSVLPLWPPAAATVPALPPNAAPRLQVYVQRLGLERFRDHPKRGIPALVLAPVQLVLSWCGMARLHFWPS